METTCDPNHKFIKPKSKRRDRKFKADVRKLLEVAKEIENAQKELKEFQIKFAEYTLKQECMPDDATLEDKRRTRRLFFYFKVKKIEAAIKVTILQRKYMSLLPKGTEHIKHGLGHLRWSAEMIWRVPLHVPTKEKDIIELLKPKHRRKRNVTRRF